MKATLRRTRPQLLLGLLLLAGACALPRVSLAQAAYPAKAVKFVNNFPPGGPSDILARGIAEHLQAALKQAFIVDNKPGAGGNVGADIVAKSAADGYTVLFGIDTAFTVNPHIYKTMPFKPGDLKPVMIMASSGLLIGTHPSVGAKMVNELVELGRKRPLNFSSGGNGSPGHLAVAVINEVTSLKISHIPYKGNTPAVTAVLAGEVDAGVLATPGMLPHVKAGKITALAVTSRQRSALAPDVPTVAEAGLPALQQEVLYLAMVPAATPEPVVQLLQRSFAEALARPEFQARLKQLDMFHEGLTGAAASKRLSELSERYQRVIATTDMKPE
jgi:tripartite-type tricarboxylate transporter receptor subunit TctC